MTHEEGKITKQQIIAAGIPLLTTLGVEAITHNPEVLAFGLIGSFACGSLAPTAIEIWRDAFVPDPDKTLDTAQKIVQAIPIEDNSDLPQDHLSKIKRILSIKMPAPARPKDGSEDELAQRPTQAAKAAAGASKAHPAAVPARFTLEEVLPAIKQVNKRGYVYFGRNADGEAVAIHLADMYHVFDVSSSGKGKSNRFRLAMAQMVNTCETYFINPLANNIKATNDERKIEVWKPIFDRLANGKPMKTAEEIQQIMRALIREIQTRKEQEANEDLSWQEKPIFVFVDELPEIFDLCPEAVKMLDKIGRTGRQFCVFCWVASQSAAVEDIGQSTATQAQYKTRLYGGGDRNSSNRLMKGPVPAEYETILQTQKGGLTLMLAEGFSSAQFVQGPLVTNEGLFAYFGLPPFDLNEWLPAKKTLPPLRNKNALNLSPDLLPSPFYPDEEEKKPVAQARHVDADEGKRVKGKRVKGPNYDAILEAVEDLEAEEKALTLNAIAKRAGLTRHQYDEIEETITYYGYDLSMGKGRPAEK